LTSQGVFVLLVLDALGPLPHGRPMMLQLVLMLFLLAGEFGYEA
jgi:hypothetical protein